MGTRGCKACTIRRRRPAVQSWSCRCSNSNYGFLRLCWRFAELRLLPITSPFETRFGGRLRRRLRITGRAKGPSFTVVVAVVVFRSPPRSYPYRVFAAQPCGRLVRNLQVCHTLVADSCKVVGYAYPTRFKRSDSALTQEVTPLVCSRHSRAAGLPITCTFVMFWLQKVTPPVCSRRSRAADSSVTSDFLTSIRFSCSRWESDLALRFTHNPIEPQNIEFSTAE